MMSTKQMCLSLLKPKTFHSKAVSYFAFPGLIVIPTVLCLSLLFFGESVQFFISFAVSALIFTLCIVLVVEMFTCETIENHFTFEVQRSESL